VGGIDACSTKMEKEQKKTPNHFDLKQHSSASYNEGDSYTDLTLRQL
jgi:hypothetical protein